MSAAVTGQFQIPDAITVEVIHIQDRRWPTGRAVKLRIRLGDLPPREYVLRERDKYRGDFTVNVYPR